MSNVKSCGGCTHWVKLTHYGICQPKDLRCNSDYMCKDWKGIKYNRNKNKINIDIKDITV